MTAIDLFAGAGGFTTGAKAAGLTVVWAGNHWQVACDTHHANHPEFKPVCQDLQQANWGAVPRHDVLLASPACQGHSRARGTDRPHHDAARATAWAIVGCAEVHRPEWIVVENVPEFARWVLYPSWTDALRRLGYAISAQIHDAADHGVPQHRRRLFVVARLGRSAFWIPPIRREHVAAETVLLPASKWSRIDGLCQNTRNRIANGRKVHGDRFLIAYYGNESGGRSLNRPLGTVTTRDRYALVEGDRLRMLAVPEYRHAMGFPVDYVLPTNRRLATHMLGNAVCPPVARDILTSILHSGRGNAG